MNRLTIAALLGAAIVLSGCGSVVTETRSLTSPWRFVGKACVCASRRATARC